ncbi:hypothetical protein EX30DRAFT_80518 [Ascodesmis nigricans]|uniref:TrkH-domain-containing protein n=1 Tax=Ascodesmis nigricans TaxID=341454 RepID=A0A4S2MT43_9PEZI|nr:hypothetical protein EX30DRAFT_80518 [Ascodesmis nigricans]
MVEPHSFQRPTGHDRPKPSDGSQDGSLPQMQSLSPLNSSSTLPDTSQDLPVLPISIAASVKPPPDHNSRFHWKWARSWTRTPQRARKHFRRYSFISSFQAVYFVSISFLASAFFLASKKADGSHLGFVDSVFLAVTSITGAGLANIALSDLGTGQQVVVMFLVGAGGQVIVAVAVLAWFLVVRKPKRDGHDEKATVHGQQNLPLENQVEDNTCRKYLPSPGPDANMIIPIDGSDWESSASGSTTMVDDTVCYPATDRYSDRRLFKFLAVLLGLYVLIIHIISTVMLFLCVRLSETTSDVIASTNSTPTSPVFWALFSTVSAFANSGLSLLDSNLAGFANGGTLLLLVHCFLILAGNTLFPLLLTWIVAILPARIPGVQEARQLPHHPCRHILFPYLLPTAERHWLAAMVLIITGINTGTFGITTFPSKSPIKFTSGWHRFLAGTFQALSVRAGGFGIVDIADLKGVVVIIYIVSMYITPFPVSLSPLTTSISAFSTSSSSLSTIVHPPHATRNFILRQLRALARAGDIKYLLLAAVIILSVENIPANGVVRIVFEVVSAYGCVGVSFSGGRGVAEVAKWGATGKFVAMAVMALGRGREGRRGLLVGWGAVSPAL